MWCREIWRSFLRKGGNILLDRLYCLKAVNRCGYLHGNPFHLWIFNSVTLENEQNDLLLTIIKWVAWQLKCHIWQYMKITVFSTCACVIFYLKFGIFLRSSMPYIVRDIRCGIFLVKELVIISNVRYQWFDVECSH